MSHSKFQALDQLKGPTLLACSTGGHLEEMYRLAEILNFDRNSRHWVTFRTDQSVGMLTGESTRFVEYISPRALGKAAMALPQIFRAIRRSRAQTVVSTGAAIAVPAAIAALALRRRFIYIESITRFDGPSLSGRIVSYLPKTECLSQTRPWGQGKWEKGPSVLSDYTVQKIVNTKPIVNVFITLGTIKPYRFDRAIEALKEIIPDDVSVRLQYGSTSGASPAGWTAREMIDDAEFRQNLHWADLVITHAGVGSTLNVLDAGKVPLLLVRESKFNEHVDDHQRELANSMDEVGLANVLDLSDLNWNKMKETANLLVEQ